MPAWGRADQEHRARQAAFELQRRYRRFAWLRGARAARLGAGLQTLDAASEHGIEPVDQAALGARSACAPA